MPDDSHPIPVKRIPRSTDRSARESDALATPLQPPPPYGPASRHVRVPLIDIYDTAAGLVLEADLPGASEQTLTIHLEHNVLSLRASLNNPAPVPAAQLIQQEYPFGDFERSFILSDDVDRSLISAELKNGVLRVLLPRAERATTRRIDVRRE